jgi:hypothetical protein
VEWQFGDAEVSSLETRAPFERAITFGRTIEINMKSHISWENQI